MSDRPVPSSFDDTEFFDEKPLHKLGRRLKEEPLIPIGIVATCYALYRAYRSMKVGDSQQVNKMFRARIYAQAFTLMACIGGSIYYKAEREQRKALQQALDEKKAQEKRDAWLRELEIRDREDQEWRERHAAIERKAKEAGTGFATKDNIDAVKSPLEEDDAKENQEKNGGVLDAVKALLRGNK
ncbi:hypothetical protein VTO42DRAFT_4905 [Malbranchea cinnamomea]